MATPLSQTRRKIGERDGRAGFEVTALGFGAGTIAGWGDFAPSQTWTDASPSEAGGVQAAGVGWGGGRGAGGEGRRPLHSRLRGILGGNHPP